MQAKVVVALLGCALCVAFARPTPVGYAPNVAFRQALKDYSPLFALQAPAGDYKGSKSVLGDTITIEVDILSSSALNLQFSGPLTLNCANEPYSISGSTITLTNINTQGDCVHDALQQNSVSIESISYDATGDDINVKAKYSFLSLSFELDHESRTCRNNRPASLRSLPEAFDKYFNTYSLRDPVGNYAADKVIFGTEIKSELKFNGADFDFSIDSPVTLSCNDEAFTESGSTLIISNLNSSTDCMNQLSQSWSVTVESLAFDATTNEINANVKFAGLPITLTYSHESNRAPIVIAQPSHFDTPKEFVDAMHARSRIPLLRDPAGTYEGSKTVLGQHVDTTMVILSSSQLSFVVSGVVTINCPSEPFTVSGNNIVLTNMGVAGDCVHDALAKNSVSLQSITYDSTANDVTVKLLYSIVTISLQLNHESSVIVRPTLADLVKYRLPIYNLRDPAGKYYGTKTVLGQTIACTTVILSSSQFSFVITGGVSVNCPTENYTYSNGAISIPGINTSGDCLHDALQANNAKFKSISYNSATDQVTFVVNMIIDITIVLSHQA
jgi:hypothetical protein